MQPSYTAPGGPTNVTPAGQGPPVYGAPQQQYPNIGNNDPSAANPNYSNAAAPNNVAPQPTPGQDKQWLVSSQGGAPGFMDRLKLGLDIWKSMPKWHTELKDTFMPPTETCLKACCCAPCFAYRQRQVLLAFTNEPNSCCLKESIPRAGGCLSKPYNPPVRGWPSSWPTSSQDGFQVKMCCEICCCFPLAINANRRLMQYRFHVTDSEGDVATMAAASICCICCRNRASTLACLTLQSCWLAQQEEELNWHINNRRDMNGRGEAGYKVWEPVFEAGPEVQVMLDEGGKHYATGSVQMRMQEDIQSNPNAVPHDGSSKVAVRRMTGPEAVVYAPSRTTSISQGGNAPR